MNAFYRKPQPPKPCACLLCELATDGRLVCEEIIKAGNPKPSK
jgi:hypothetical protein